MNQRGFVAKYWPYLFVALPIALQLIFFFYPLITGVFYSLTDWNGLSSSYDVIGIQNYIDILKDPDFYTSITFTIIFTIGLVIGEIVIGIWLATLLNRKIIAQSENQSSWLFPDLVFLPSSFVNGDLGSHLWSTFQLRFYTDWRNPSYRLVDGKPIGTRKYRYSFCPLCRSLAGSGNASHHFPIWFTKYSR